MVLMVCRKVKAASLKSPKAHGAERGCGRPHHHGAQHGAHEDLPAAAEEERDGDLRRRKNMVGVNMVLAECHQIKTWLLYI